MHVYAFWSCCVHGNSHGALNAQWAFQKWIYVCQLRCHSRIMLTEFSAFKDTKSIKWKRYSHCISVLWHVADILSWLFYPFSWKFYIHSFKEWDRKLIYKPPVRVFYLYTSRHHCLINKAGNVDFKSGILIRFLHLMCFMVPIFLR